ncbi:MAG: histidinol phosphate phosphatase domain-containing protein [Bacillota bacterium]
MIYDFHTHTFFSDGVLSPVELARRAVEQGYGCLGIADHASASNMEYLIRNLAKDAELVEKYWPIKVLIGVELTHVPAEAVDELARAAKKIGAQYVVVHGETVTEPVVKGANLAAVKSAHVDILAHPGMIGEEEAKLAAENRVFLEITSRGGHNTTNGHVAALARKCGALMLVDSDAHGPEDLMSGERVLLVASGAGLNPDEVKTALERNPLLLLKKIKAE